MAFGAATALLTALGRVQGGLDQALASPRYGSGALVFWTAMAFLCWSFARADAKAARGVTLATIAVVVVFIACTQWPFIAERHDIALDRRAGEAALLSNVDDRVALSLVYPSPEFLQAQAKLLKAERASVFAEPWSDWLGTSILAHVRMAPAKRCAGVLDTIAPIAPGSGAGWRARGWAFDWKRKSVPRVILLAQEDGTIVGYGLPGYKRRDVVRGLHKRAALDSGWHGAFSVAQPTIVTAYALLDGANAACALLGPKQIDAPAAP